uniref:HYR domain-containing protein n=1 Tax=Chromera velia CCMP2878 TaxID=1169474 RepID=A0A0G4HLJ1_9ALVE|eukprot:Cvel_7348.t1-p1 / transcript=Cvel_7348.t1 / gene=Cvel_7348 / organism=Chromera_velia_CCMP2878 / gene_product=hypothetical protein / transcript_product=hypothetical protein / location=Cvel_scaffold381:37028-50354(+) / protein_length=1603 / sequence_SO=supercontig / SO=protein_coding / is_pseudo=false
MAEWEMRTSVGSEDRRRASRGSSCANAETDSKETAVNDTTAPVVVCPNTVTEKVVNKSLSVPVYFPGPLRISDDTDASTDVTISYSVKNGSFFSEDLTSVRITATDTSGNSDYCTFDVLLDRIGYYRDTTVASTVVVCRACPQFATSEDGATHPSACSCQNGYYLVPPLTSLPSDSQLNTPQPTAFWTESRCWPCPDHGTCFGGLVSEQVHSTALSVTLGSDITVRRRALTADEEDGGHSSFVSRDGPRTTRSGHKGRALTQVDITAFHLRAHSRPIPDNGYALVRSYPSALIIPCPIPGSCLRGSAEQYQDLEPEGKCFTGMKGPTCSECTTGYQQVILKTLFNFLSNIAVLGYFSYYQIQIDWNSIDEGSGGFLGWFPELQFTDFIPINSVPALQDFFSFSCVIDGVELLSSEWRFFFVNIAEAHLFLALYVIVAFMSFLMVFGYRLCRCTACPGRAAQKQQLKTSKSTVGMIQAVGGFASHPAGLPEGMGATADGSVGLAGEEEGDGEGGTKGSEEGLQQRKGVTVQSPHVVPRIHGHRRSSFALVVENPRREEYILMRRRQVRFESKMRLLNVYRYNFTPDMTIFEQSSYILMDSVAVASTVFFFAYDIILAPFVLVFALLYLVLLPLSVFALMGREKSKIESKIRQDFLDRILVESKEREAAQTRRYRAEAVAADKEIQRRQTRMKQKKEEKQKKEKKRDAERAADPFALKEVTPSEIVARDLPSPEDEGRDGKANEQVPASRFSNTRKSATGQKVDPESSETGAAEKNSCDARGRERANSSDSPSLTELSFKDAFNNPRVRIYEFNRLFSFLIGGFKREWFFGEFVIMTRKLSLELALGWAMNDNPNSRYIPLLLHAVVFLYIQVTVQPFLEDEGNVMNKAESISLLAWAILLILFVGLNVFPLSSGGTLFVLLVMFFIFSGYVGLVSWSDRLAQKMKLDIGILRASDFIFKRQEEKRLVVPPDPAKTERTLVVVDQTGQIKERKGKESAAVGTIAIPIFSTISRYALRQFFVWRFEHEEARAVFASASGSRARWGVAATKSSQMRFSVKTLPGVEDFLSRVALMLRYVGRHHEHLMLRVQQDSHPLEIKALALDFLYPAAMGDEGGGGKKTVGMEAAKKLRELLSSPVKTNSQTQRDREKEREDEDKKGGGNSPSGGGKGKGGASPSPNRSSRVSESPFLSSPSLPRGAESVADSGTEGGHYGMDKANEPTLGSVWAETSAADVVLIDHILMETTKKVHSGVGTLGKRDRDRVFIATLRKELPKIVTLSRIGRPLVNSRAIMRTGEKGVVDWKLFLALNALAKLDSLFLIWMYSIYLAVLFAESAVFLLKTMDKEAKKAAMEGSDSEEEEGEEEGEEGLKKAKSEVGRKGTKEIPPEVQGMFRDTGAATRDFSWFFDPSKSRSTIGGNGQGQPTRGESRSAGLFKARSSNRIMAPTDAEDLRGLQEEIISHQEGPPQGPNPAEAVAAAGPGGDGEARLRGSSPQSGARQHLVEKRLEKEKKKDKKKRRERERGRRRTGGGEDELDSEPDEEFFIDNQPTSSPSQQSRSRHHRPTERVLADGDAPPVVDDPWDEATAGTGSRMGSRIGAPGGKDLLS